MAEHENPVTQYESPNEGSGNARASDSYESPSPLHVPEQPVYDHWKLNILIYTIEVLWMTLSTFFVQFPSMSTCPIIISSRIRGKSFSYTGERTKS
jgi:hypothetical protein